MGLIYREFTCASTLIGLFFLLIQLIPYTVTLAVDPQGLAEVEASRPAEDPRRCIRSRTLDTMRIANFDDIVYTDSPRTQVPVPYQGLFFNRFFVERQSGFLIAASPENYAISYDYRLPRQITAEYAGSTVRSFDLKSLYYGCSQGVPQAECVIEITGIKASPSGRDGQGKQRTVTQTVTYPALIPPVDPATLLLGRAVFGKEWTDLVTVNFTATQNGQPTFFAGLVIDSVEYVTHECVGFKS